MWVRLQCLSIENLGALLPQCPASGATTTISMIMGSEAACWPALGQTCRLNSSLHNAILPHPLSTQYVHFGDDLETQQQHKVQKEEKVHFVTITHTTSECYASNLDGTQLLRLVMQAILTNLT